MPFDLPKASLRRSIDGALLAGLLVTGTASGSPVDIVAVELAATGDRARPTVTLRHADSGWDHYADGWRIVAADGRVLVHRTLYHPHENGQAFTRSGAVFALPAGDGPLYVEARDNVDGWNARRALDPARDHLPTKGR